MSKKDFLSLEGLSAYTNKLLRLFAKKSETVAKSGDAMTGTLHAPAVSGLPGAGDQLSLMASDATDEQGAYVSLCKSTHASHAGGWAIAARNPDAPAYISALFGYPDGRLILNQNTPEGGAKSYNIVKSVNGTPAGSDGNVAQGVGMVPTEEFSNVTVGASGTMYAAPWDGYFAFGSSSGGGDAYAWCRVYETGIVSNNLVSVSWPGAICAGSVPVKKGQRVSLNYLNVTGVSAYFIRAQGAQ